MRLPFSWSAGPVKARRQLPPYLPISSQRLHDEELRRLGQALVDRGQLAGLHLLGEHRGFLEGLRKGLGVEDDLRPLELADQRRADLRGFAAAGVADCAAAASRPHRKRAEESKTRQHTYRAHRFHTNLLFPCSVSVARKARGSRPIRLPDGRRPPPTPRRQEARNHTPVSAILAPSTVDEACRRSRWPLVELINAAVPIGPDVDLDGDRSPRGR